MRLGLIFNDKLSLFSEFDVSKTIGKSPSKIKMAWVVAQRTSFLAQNYLFGFLLILRGPESVGCHKYFYHDY